MDQLRTWGEQLLAHLQETAQTIAAYVPSVFIAIIVVFVGWLIAKLLRLAAIRAIYRIDWLFGHKDASESGDHDAAHQALTRAIAAAVFWIVFLIAIAAALGNLGIQLVDDWTARLLRYLPILLGGLFIILFSFFCGSLTRQVVEPAAESIGAANSELIGRLSQIAVVITGAVIGTGVLGIDVTFVIQLTTVVVGVGLAGLAFAFALGIREHLANVVGIRYAQKHFNPGEFVKIGEHEGHIIRFADGYLFLETALGDISIPGCQFSREPFIRLAKEPASGR